MFATYVKQGIIAATVAFLLVAFCPRTTAFAEAAETTVSSPDRPSTLVEAQSASGAVTPSDAIRSQQIALATDQTPAHQADAQQNGQDTQVQPPPPQTPHPAQGQVSDKDAVLIAFGAVVVVLLVVIAA